MAKNVIKFKLKIKKGVVGFAVFLLLGVCGVFPTRPYVSSNTIPIYQTGLVKAFFDERFFNNEG
ncbi:MAG: hypothetical protein WC782_15170 [Methylococcaceae bacterium]|jgi:hypothetical protein